MTKKILLTLSFLAFLNAQHTHDHESWIRCATDELE